MRNGVSEQIADACELRGARWKRFDGHLQQVQVNSGCFSTNWRLSVRRMLLHYYDSKSNSKIAYKHIPVEQAPLQDFFSPPPHRCRSINRMSGDLLTLTAPGEDDRLFEASSYG